MFGPAKPAFGAAATSTGFGFTNTATASPFGQSAFGKPATSAFGGAPTFGTQQAAPSMFGASATQPQGTGLFGTQTATSTFGGTTTAQPTFGAFQQPQQNTSIFGAAQTTATPNTLFGQSTTSAFGAAVKPAGLSTFGQTATQPTTSLFGQTATPASTSGFGTFGQAPATTTNVFGSSNTSAFGQPVAGSAVAVNAGTASAKYQPTVGTDTLIKGGQPNNVNTKQHCITAMKEYESKSLEELRMENYLANRKGPQVRNTSFESNTPFEFEGSRSKIKASKTNMANKNKQKSPSPNPPFNFFENALKINFVWPTSESTIANKDKPKSPFSSISPSKSILGENATKINSNWPTSESTIANEDKPKSPFWPISPMKFDETNTSGSSPNNTTNLILKELSDFRLQRELLISEIKSLQDVNANLVAMVSKLECLIVDMHAGVCVNSTNASTVRNSNMPTTKHSTVTAAKKLCSSSAETSYAAVTCVAKNSSTAAPMPAQNEINLTESVIDTESLASAHNDARSDAVNVVADESDNIELSVFPRKKWFHLSSFSNSVTVDDIIAFVHKHTKISINDIECFRLTKKDAVVSELKYVNFKLGVPSAHFKTIFDATLWPVNVEVRPFKFFRKAEIVARNTS